MERRCDLCPGRVCVDLTRGRLINDNNGEIPVDTSKISTSEIDIEHCNLRSNYPLEDLGDWKYLIDYEAYERERTRD